MTDADAFEDRLQPIYRQLVIAIVDETNRRIPGHSQWRERLDSMQDVASEAVHMIDGWVNQAVTIIVEAPEEQGVEQLRRELDDGIDL